MLRHVDFIFDGEAFLTTCNSLFKELLTPKILNGKWGRVTPHLKCLWTYLVLTHLLTKIIKITFLKFCKIN